MIWIFRISAFILYLTLLAFPNPDTGIVVEPLPSSYLPYDLRITLGYLAARTTIFFLYLGFPHI
nr:MAG TPA: hypothetical protein [Caudoviricetes sp.]